MSHAASAVAQDKQCESSRPHWPGEPAVRRADVRAAVVVRSGRVARPGAGARLPAKMEPVGGEWERR
jgi:hypothetical protein